MSKDHDHNDQANIDRRSFIKTGAAATAAVTAAGLGTGPAARTS